MYNGKCSTPCIGTTSDEGGVGLQELMDRYRVNTVQLDREIPDNEVPVIAAYFDSLELYSQAMGLSAADQSTVKTSLVQYDAQSAMAKCLSIWKQKNSFKATFRALLELLLRLNRTEVAAQVCQYLTQNVSTVKHFNYYHNYTFMCIYAFWTLILFWG